LGLTRKENNGNFLALVELIEKFHPVLQEHLRQITLDEIHDHYLVKRIQHELITLMADKIKESILDSARWARYFSTILDYTADQSYKEQMSIILRFVDINEDVSIRKHFVGFIVVEDSTSQGLTNAFLDELQKCNLSITNCRGQGYDNAANMKGKNSGVQRRFLDMNQLAFFVLCGCHSLNLVVGDASKSIGTASSLFGFLQKICFFLCIHIFLA